MAGETYTWEKLKSVSALLASVLVPIVLGLVGHWYSGALKQVDANLRYSELAIDILKRSPTETDAAIREWAIDVIDSYSGIPLNKQARLALQKSSILEIEEFLQEKWIPEFISAYIDELFLSAEWKKLVSDAVTLEDQKHLYRSAVEAAIEEIHKERQRRIEAAAEEEHKP
ncbi:hypothetical protein JXJ21_00215 [candidate division KSB1 bacterium]|nr:hypothetical protein [candidate division KSB1 bacterium]